MGDPHNPLRSEETWDARRIELQALEIQRFGDLLTVSGGWAWHFMSPPGHVEYKTQHDHKDVDVFVTPKRFQEFVIRAKLSGFERAATRHDDPSGVFYRYTKFLDNGKVVFDVYVADVPTITVDGQQVVNPVHLLTLYATTHSSKECWAVKAAMKLLGEGIDPVRHPSLVRPTSGK